MSKILHVLCVLGIFLFSNSLYATKFKAGKHYMVLNKPATSKPQVLELFSFYCYQCYQLQYKFNLQQALKKMLPSHGQLKQCHIPGFGPLGDELTRAWIAAQMMGIEDKIGPLLFIQIQKENSIRKKNDIRNLFITTGVSSETYDQTINSFQVNSLLSQQKNLIGKHDHTVPTLIINGKYCIKPEKLACGNIEEFLSEYLALASYLLTKKEN